MTTTDIAARRPSRFAVLWVDGFLWGIRLFAIIFITWGLLGSIVLTSQGDGLSGAAWRDLFISGLAQGSMYGLIALGYSMVYGVLGFINFAHGEVFMSGAMVAYFAADALFEAGVWESSPALSIGFTLLVSAATSLIVAVLVERVAYRPLRDAPRLIPLITSIGMSFFLQYAVRGLFGGGFQSYPPVSDWLRSDVFVWRWLFSLLVVGLGAVIIWALYRQSRSTSSPSERIVTVVLSAAVVALAAYIVGRVQLEGDLDLGVQKIQFIVIVIAATSMFALYQFVERTKTGRAMRAVAEDKEIAGLMGINVDRIIVTTFAVGGFMAGVAGMLWALLFRQINFLTGFLPGIKAFTAAVLGGIGNLVGAMLGGVSLGLFESLGPQVILGGLRWELALPLLVAAILAGIVVIGAARRRYTASAWWQAGLGVSALALVAIVVVPSWRNLGLSIVIPSLSQLKDVVAFTALVLVLVFKPTGLLGERLAVEERA